MIQQSTAHVDIFYGIYVWLILFSLQKLGSIAYINMFEGFIQIT
jgi:hypothetical protein